MDVNISTESSPFDSKPYDRLEFVTSTPFVAIPILVVLFIAAIVGTFGNVLVLVVLTIKIKPRGIESIFMANLAISDLYVTLIADTMSIVAKLEGETFFTQFPRLCQTIASLCTISCVASLMTIAALSANRYIYICMQEKYERIFTKRNSICICLSVYLVGLTLVLLNQADVGGHGFDRKSLECIWDRMATYPFTVVFSVALVWIPAIIIGLCYLKIFLYVRAHTRRFRELVEMGAAPKTSVRSFQLAKTLFIIYAVFITCWAPFALIITADSNDKFPYQAHLYITVFAHLHPSLNWLIYFLTNKKFAKAYRQIFMKCSTKPIPIPREDEFESASKSKTLDSNATKSSDTLSVSKPVPQNSTAEQRHCKLQSKHNSLRYQVFVRKEIFDIE